MSHFKTDPLMKPNQMARPRKSVCYTRLVMPTVAVVLVTVSAFVHAFWNLLGKRQNPSTAFFFIATAFAALCLSPLLIVYHSAFTAVPARVWLWVGLTSLFELIYYIGLAGAYRHGDLSVAYPLVRALPVILVAILTTILSLGKPLSLAGVGGILLVAVGCLLLPIRNLRQVRLGTSLLACCLLAGLAALGTTGYTLVDNQALADLQAATSLGLSRLEIAFFYLALGSIAITLAMGFYLLIFAGERAELAKTWSTGKGMTLLTGLLIVGTYGLVLAAMEYAQNVSYITAFRQLSIPLGAALGVFVQREPVYPLKVASIAVISAGLVLIALA